MQIIQIVPRLPPAIDGVGDYALLLAKELRAAHGIQTVFVVCDTAWGKAEGRKQKSEIELDGFKVFQLQERSAAELLRVLSLPEMPQTILLQYVGYGYQKRGCPLWLVRGLEKWLIQKPKSANSEKISDPQLSTFNFQPQRRMLTMFHELYASGPIWRSSFWTSRVQRWIAKSLAQMSGHCVTNLTVNARTLRQMTGRPEKDFTVMPVFSNVGEPEQLPDWNGRKPRMIVFGSAGQRRKVYFEHRDELERACQTMELDEIVDIGAPFEIPPLSVRVSQRGILSATEVSREMLAARAGFFAYPTAYLGKSGVFAAYAAHGLVPVTFEANKMINEDALKMDEHFIASSTFSEGIQIIGEKVRDWYLKHSVKCQAKSFEQCLSHESLS